MKGLIITSPNFYKSNTFLSVSLLCIITHNLLRVQFADKMGITTLEIKMKNTYNMQLQETSFKMFLKYTTINNNTCFTLHLSITSQTPH